MWRDSDLDGLEAANLAAGGNLDGVPNSEAGYYAQVSANWGQLAGWLVTACTTDTPIPAAEIAEADGWMNTAIQGHEIDRACEAQDDGWDTTWINNYDLVETMLAEM